MIMMVFACLAVGWLLRRNMLFVW
ncbi:hypothetical protein GPY37_09960 [Photorhabdus kayaii]|uniref:Uncharacterized protein n=1 Tax=Photorhabdus kayaii TaxID=230088 RepID=A0ABX0B4N6_9GAMM|nr:hypothetical protein [Photorhabdus kayaii]NDL25679.1 hypothetical protein [Photorhabdus kayaii]